MPITHWGAVARFKLFWDWSTAKGVRGAQRLIKQRHACVMGTDLEASIIRLGMILCCGMIQALGFGYMYHLGCFGFHVSYV